MTRPAEFSYPDAVSDLLRSETDPHAKAVARWQCCADVLRYLAEYRPDAPPEEPGEVRGLRKLGPDELRKTLENPHMAPVAFAFGTWRAAVTAWEAQHASRLQLLAQTVLTLIELRAYFDPDTVDQALSRVGDWLSRVWRVEAPLQGDLRAWATRAAVNHDVLPRAWRRL